MNDTLIGKLAPLRARRLWMPLALLVLGALWLGLRLVGVASQRDETWARIQREKVLRVGMDASYPPFEVIDADGRYLGLDVDLARELARRWGVEVQFVSLHFDGLYDALKTDKFDLILSALPYDQMLTRDVLYSQSYFSAGQVLLARADNPGLASFAALEGHRVAVELGAEAHQLARTLIRDKGLHAEILTAREPEGVLALLREGQADALICDYITAASYLQEGDLRLVGSPLTDEPYVIATRPESSTLMQQLNDTLAEFRATGLLDDLEQRWLAPRLDATLSL